MFFTHRERKRDMKSRRDEKKFPIPDLASSEARTLQSKASDGMASCWRVSV